MKNDSRPTFRKTPSEGVTEVVGSIGRGWSLASLRSGELMAAGGPNCRISTDDGLTWSKAQRFPDGIAGDGLIRLKSGALALYNTKQIWLSHDEGETWNAGSSINMLGSPYYATLIQLSNGRLLYPSRVCYSNSHHTDLPSENLQTYGLWRGIRRQLAGHYHHPEIDIASVSYSDDEGKTWQLCDGSLMGWFDSHGIPNGYGGITACDEPSVAETKDGRQLFFARSTVGRIVQSYSRDGGVTWSAIRPNELACSYSPPRLVSIPRTGDLMCVWNQVSREEIRRGYRRGRLSVAISEDSGTSWKNFKTIEVSAGLEDVDRILPESPIIPVIGLPDVGQIPDDFAVFRYPNVCFAENKVYLMYAREWFYTDAESPNEVKMNAELVLRIHPLDDFYC